MTNKGVPKQGHHENYRTQVFSLTAITDLMMRTYQLYEGRLGLGLLTEVVDRFLCFDGY